MAHEVTHGPRMGSLDVLEQSLRNLVHRPPVIVAKKQVAVAVHRDL